MCLAPGFSELSLEEQVQLVQRTWNEDIPRLLIFDNCESESLFVEWRPKTGGCHVLITSRRGQWSSTLGIHPLALGVLDRAESVALLSNHRPDLDGHTGLEEIARELGDLPLALHMAGSFLATYQTTNLGEPYRYLQNLRDKKLLEHPSLRGRGITHSPTGHGLNVGRTFALSYEQLDETQLVDHLAQQLLARAAYLSPGDSIPRPLLIATLETDDDEEFLLDVEDALRRLGELGLAEEKMGGRIMLHPLVAMFVQSLEDSVTAQEAVEQTFIRFAAHLNHMGYPDPLLICQNHLRAVTERARSREDERAATLCDHLGCHLKLVGDYAGARPYLESALSIAERALGLHHPYTAAILSNLADLLQLAGDYAASRHHYERSLAIREHTCGPDHLDTAKSLNNLGDLLRTLGEYKTARRHLTRALEICDRTVDAEEAFIAAILNNLGLLLKTMGDYTAAHPYYERSLAIRERVLGPTHYETSISLNNLAGLLRATGNYMIARHYYERSLKIRVEVLGKDHPYTATALNNLGLLVGEMGNHSVARQYMQRALAICERVLGPDHPHTHMTRINISQLQNGKAQPRTATNKKTKRKK